MAIKDLQHCKSILTKREAKEIEPGIEVAAALDTRPSAIRQQSLLLSIRDARGNCFGGKISSLTDQRDEYTFSPKHDFRQVTGSNQPERKLRHT